MDNSSDKIPIITPAHNAAAQAEQLHQRALMLEEKRQYDEAVTCLLKALAIAPQAIKIHLELALFLLRRGELTPGFMEYEWRWKLKDRAHIVNMFRFPYWNGMRLPAGRIALIGDQGAGDKVQFCRYIPMVAERCKEVFLACPETIADLFTGIKGLTRIVTNHKDMPPCDAFCPLSSLPYIFGTTLDTVPYPGPYIKVSSQKIAAWKARLDDRARPGTLRVGISWAGNPTHVKDKWRSTRLAQWQPVLDVPDVSFFSLQKQIPEADAGTLAAEKRLIDLTADITAFSDTAALIENLDLVIAVDTSVAHLAGALGKPAWVLLQWVPDWRWLMDREDSPWYPTLRLFRQDVKNEWSGSFRRAAEELRDVAAGGRQLLLKN